MLPATDSTAFLIGQTIGFLFVFFLLVIFPMLAILRMARHVGISGSDRVLWVVVIYCMPLFGPVTYFIWELTKGRKLRRTVPEAVRPNSGTPVAPERKANRMPAAPGHSGIDYRLRNRLRPLLKNLPEKERTGPVRPAATPLAGTGRGYAGE